jgi:hypothetical protein
MFQIKKKRKRRHFFKIRTTECVTDLDQRSKMIIFGSILTTFESSSIFGGSWGSIENWFEPKIQTTIGIFSLPKSVKRSVSYSEGDYIPPQEHFTKFKEFIAHLNSIVEEHGIENI